ncbi:type I restriction-modification system endonuclease [Polyangium sp. y55x31]|uniref:type I restriction-modification system endonuclease n=1 Tax=Polyangium sp. y55x31 TaxID=3042688 RepID=UPI00248213F6|nr:type I restriction-modification system endonuclease [Polyangium sp. y55x31]MDI1475390.1 type I restriction-modification system endonuclease [Polyangium sp. y55x31]
MPTASPNFAYLAHHDPLLAILGTQAERYFADDPNTCLIKLRQFGELLAKHAAARLGLYTSPAEDTQAILINRLHDRGALDVRTKQIFHDLRLVGNKAAHEVQGSHHEALHQLKMARELGVWFQRSFGNHRRFDPGPFVPPPGPKDDAELAKELEALRAELAKSKVDVEAMRAAAEEEARKRLTAEQLAQKEAEDRALWEALATEEAERRAKDVEAVAKQKAAIEAELAALQAKAAAAPAETMKFLTRAAEASRDVYLDEAATRRLIDEQLRAVGWEVDSERLSYKRGARPEKGKNRAIAEWPTENGRADYVLFVGTVALGVVEAKRLHKDVAGTLDQAQRYSVGFVAKDGAELVGGTWGKKRHHVPFLFATNGRPYLEQVKEKSGIWFRDARRDENPKKPLQGWYSPEGLEALMKQDIDAAHDKLRSEPTSYLGLRDYQIRAIQAVEAAIAAGNPSCLVAMATGTGKTKTAIGLVYRLIKAKRFRRVLFLVDRSALGEQTGDAFKETRLENLQSFHQIFDMKELGDIKPESDTKLHIATVQSLVKRVLNATDPADVPPVDQYDCLVVDECHRGYTLDRELSETELGFRDFDDYISKYRRVLDHFDAVKIGLTATPALHTTEIFGAPAFRYSYREAVIDGMLVDHEPPIRIVTELAQKGIQWAKGEDVKVYDPGKAQLDLIHLADEVKIEIDGFNRNVITENFNRVVCEALAEHIDPMGDAKTLVFAVNDDHAQLVERLLREAFTAKYGAIDNDAVKKITGSSDKPLQRIREYKNERLPNVAITVDLLTTGIDVPRISNLVFLRRVKSRILYEQILGRATRLCPEIGKTVFRIFDAVELYDALEQYTEMKPVAPSPSVSFAQLVAELGHADPEARKLALDQLVAKLRRRAPALKGDDLSRFEGIASMSPPSLAAMLRRQTPEEAAAWFGQHGYLVPLLDGRFGEARPLLVSDHADRVVAVEVGYGKGTRPEDYLDSFSAFLRENMNKIPALVVVTQRPRDLTRAALRELLLALDAKGYTEAALQAAWRQASNADIAASIIGYIRKAALGDPLVPYEERVARATAKILARPGWTSIQRQWLQRIGKQLERERVVDRDTIDASEAFKSNGGFKHLDKVFGGKLDAILGDLREEVWKDAG